MEGILEKLLSTFCKLLILSAIYLENRSIYYVTSIHYV